ncbi:MAG: TlyA family RNA methyltransferase [Clostridia bacterium]
MRLDFYLFAAGYARSRTHAANLIKLGRVSINGVKELKPSREILPDKDVISLDNSNDFASLGGLKLQKALEVFKISALGKVAIDIGASNGGFTDVLLKEGASRVFAVDVSENAFDEELKADERVVVKDRLNARYLDFEDIGIKADIITVDVSFISLKLIIPSLLKFKSHGGAIIALVKPQFEVGSKQLSKRGLVKNKRTAEKSVEEVAEFCRTLGLQIAGVTQAPRPFADKNQEYFLHLI